MFGRLTCSHRCTDPYFSSSHGLRNEIAASWHHYDFRIDSRTNVYGKSTSFPTTSRLSKRRCALAASASGNVLARRTLSVPSAIQLSTSLPRRSKSSVARGMGRGISSKRNTSGPHVHRCKLLSYSLPPSFSWIAHGFASTRNWIPVR